MVDSRLYPAEELEASGSPTATSMSFAVKTLPMKDALLELASLELTVAIPFLFRPQRVQYLAKVLASVRRVPSQRTVVHISTSAADEEALSILNRLGRSYFGEDAFRVHTPELESPTQLVWHHKELLRDFCSQGRKGLFVYTEDDIEVGVNNIVYFLRYLPVLDTHRLIPSFIRVEFNHRTKYLHPTDFTKKDHVTGRYASVVVDDILFVNVINPYTGCFIMTQSMAAEHMGSDYFDAERSSRARNWGGARLVLERANMGLCYESLPHGFSSRYVVPFKKGSLVPLPDCWVYHLPNNYTNTDRSFGRLPLDQTFY